MGLLRGPRLPCLVPSFVDGQRANTDRDGSDGLERGRLLTASEVAEVLGVPTSWVYERSRRGRIPTVTLGRYRRYRAEAIQAWLREREQSHV